MLKTKSEGIKLGEKKDGGRGGHTGAGVWPPDVKSPAEHRVLVFRVSQGLDLLSGRNAARFHRPTLSWKA